MCQRKLHSYVRPSSRLVKVAEKRAVSYARILGCRDMPTIVYHPGFMNQKWGKKSTLLAQFCADKRLSYVTFLRQEKLFLSPAVTRASDLL
ncbi:unnamed protein product [Notodromas monacha]|uniref:Uncharacterized protein n=1 Tax=Notodromas monacha TaxID=399045 RepID=A0A7R9C1H7_9CRUS|nr:unnamed protein product [Notodromas monacha]CAG0925179.1 unnamed protein product [Notodromas monacha]